MTAPHPPDSERTPHHNRDGCNPYDEAHIAGKAGTPLSLLLNAIERMDQRVTPYGDPLNDEGAAYIVGISTWHHVLSAARRVGQGDPNGPFALDATASEEPTND